MNLSERQFLRDVLYFCRVFLCMVRFGLKVSCVLKKTECSVHINCEASWSDLSWMILFTITGLFFLLVWVHCRLNWWIFCHEVPPTCFVSDGLVADLHWNNFVRITFKLLLATEPLLALDTPVRFLVVFRFLLHLRIMIGVSCSFVFVANFLFLSNPWTHDFSAFYCVVEKM